MGAPWAAGAAPGRTPLFQGGKSRDGPTDGAVGADKRGVPNGIANMLALAPETQLRAYASLRSLETRALAIEEMIGSIKRSCLHGGLGAVADLIAATAELRWQLGQANELTGALEATLGVQRSNDGAPEKRREQPESSGMRGTTDVLGVPDLVSLLSSLRKTGTLALHAGEAMFVFEFQEGKIVHAVTNQQDDDLRLGTILVAQNKLTEEQLEDCLDASAQTNSLLGTHLVHSATVSEVDLRAALDVQVRRIFDLAFAVRFARFTFVDGSISNIAQRTTVNTTHLLLEAARQRDEGRHEGRPEQGSSSARDTLDSILG